MLRPGLEASGDRGRGAGRKHVEVNTRRSIYRVCMVNVIGVFDRYEVSAGVIDETSSDFFVSPVSVEQ